jgi:hypothetical protein
MASNARDPSGTGDDTPYTRAHQSLVLQLEALREGKGRLFDLLIAGEGDENDINAEINELKERSALKLKEQALLRTQAYVSAGPTAAEVAALRASVAKLESMNAVAAGVQGIMDATLNIADAVLYSPKPTGAARLASSVPGSAGLRSAAGPATAATSSGTGSLLASAATGAAIAIAAVALIRSGSR